MALGKQIADLSGLIKKFMPVAENATRKKSLYASLSPTQKSEHVEAALQNIIKNNPDIDVNTIKNNDLLDALRKRMYSEQEFLKNNEGLSLLDLNKENPALHQRNLDLEKQADAFLKEHDPEFFEELNQAMKNYDENVTGLPQNDLIEYMKSNYDTDMSEAFNQAAANQYKKDFIKNLYENDYKNKQINASKREKEVLMLYNKDKYTRELLENLFNKELSDEIVEQPLNYHLSKDPLENASEIDFPETSLNRRYHNVAVPKGKYYFEGQHKPGDYYHNILWNYVNKGPNRDAMLDEFFKDILHKETPTNPQEKFNIVKNYKNALDKRRLDIDMKNIPYNKHKFNNMKAIEDYFEQLRPTSFEDFESKILHPSLTEKTTLKRIVHPEEFMIKR